MESYGADCLAGDLVVAYLVMPCCLLCVLMRRAVVVGARQPVLVHRQAGRRLPEQVWLVQACGPHRQAIWLQGVLAFFGVALH